MIFRWLKPHLSPPLRPLMWSIGTLLHKYWAQSLIWEKQDNLSSKVDTVKASYIKTSSDVKDQAHWFDKLIK